MTNHVGNTIEITCETYEIPLKSHVKRTKYKIPLKSHMKRTKYH